MISDLPRRFPPKNEIQVPWNKIKRGRIGFSCVVQDRDEHGEPDDVRTCVEGPVFDACRSLFTSVR